MIMELKDKPNTQTSNDFPPLQNAAGPSHKTHASILKSIPERNKKKESPKKPEGAPVQQTDNILLKPKKPNKRFINRLHERHEAFKAALEWSESL